MLLSATAIRCLLCSTLKRTQARLKYSIASAYWPSACMLLPMLLRAAASRCVSPEAWASCCARLKSAMASSYWSAF